MDFLPLFCQLQNKPVLIVGGGEVAVRKARLLLDAKAKITINAPHLEPQLMSWAEQGQPDRLRRRLSSQNCSMASGW